VIITKKEVKNVVEEVQELKNTFLLSVPSTSGSYANPSEQRNASKPGKRKLVADKISPKHEKQNEEWIMLLKKGIEERTIIFETNKLEKDDPIDIFFKSIASTIKSFSPSLKIRAKREVFDIVHNFEIENINNNCLTPRSNDNSEYSSYSDLSIQSCLSGFTKNNIPTPTYVFSEMTNNHLITVNNCMQCEENYYEETQL